MFKKLVRPRLAPPTELEDPRPPTFAQLVGLIITGAGLVLGLAGVSAAVPVAAAFALVAAFLNAVFGLCLGCELYLLGLRLRAGRHGLVDERLRALGQRLLDEHRRARDPDAGQHVLRTDAPARGALRAHGHAAALEHQRPAARPAGSACSSTRSPARPGRANHADSPVSQRLTSAPAATAAAATVKAWLVASGRSVPDVVLITRGRGVALIGTG